MGYADRDEPAPGPAAEPDLLDRAGSVIGILVRLIGVALLCVGVAVGLKVISEAFQLYNQPQSIERFVVAVEQGSNLDAALAPLEEVIGDSASRRRPPTLRLSYFAAWVVVLMLLVVVSGIAMAVVATGGRLALGSAAMRKGR